jgi:hypothetical protein
MVVSVIEMRQLEDDNRKVLPVNIFLGKEGIIS